ncbi:MAG: DUF1761 domain-containing protein [Candidatus Pacearchaeota archaeon]|jgi:hypothetical protein
MLDVILIGIIGTIISVIIGTFWYSMSTPMGRLHMQSIGFTKLSKDEQKKAIEKEKPYMWKSYVIQMILSFLTSFFIAFVTKYTIQNGQSGSSVYFYVVFIWLSFIIPIIGQSLIWGNIPKNLRVKKFISDSIYNLITYILIATAAIVVLSFF